MMPPAIIKLTAYIVFLLKAQSCIYAKEIVPSHKWQKLMDNDTIPAGMHVKVDLSTGEKWAKIAGGGDDDETFASTSVELKGDGNVEIV